MTSSCLVGVGATPFVRGGEADELTLAHRAVRAALDDAGLAPADVDGVVRFGADAVSIGDLTACLGAGTVRFAADDGEGGGSACGAVDLADVAVRAGRARVVVVWRAIRARSGWRPGHPSQTGAARGPSPVAGEFTGPYGLTAPAHVFALWCSAYRHRYGVGEAQFADATAAVALRQRAHAAANPAAVLASEPLDRDGYDASPVVADPLRVADLCLETDGACAVVVASGDVARDTRSPVGVLGATRRIAPAAGRLHLTDGELPPAAVTGLGAELLAGAGLTPADVDVLATYDATTSAVVLDVEALGLAAPGEGPAWVQDPGNRFNTAGGMLAEGYVVGLNNLVELVRCLRGGDAVGLASGPAATTALLLGGAGC